MSDQPSTIPQAPNEVGALTQRLFRYQNAYGIVLLLERELNGLPPYRAVYCEQAEDLLGELSENEWHAFQIKTREEQYGPWRLNDEALLHALRGFLALARRDSRVTRFNFVSNLPVIDGDAKDNVPRSPARLAAACRASARLEQLPKPFDQAFEKLRTACGCTDTELWDVLRRTEFVLGPTRRSFESMIMERYLSHFRDAAQLSFEELQSLLDDMVARFEKAAGSDVALRVRPQPPNRLTQEDLVASLERVWAVRRERESRAGLLAPYRGTKRNAGGILNFVQYYTKQANLAVPFGGREAQLAELDAWLGNASAPPYLLLSSPAASGKSALLVQWVEQLQARGNREVVFYPISYRFNTNAAADVFSFLTGALEPASARPANVDWRREFSAALPALPAERPLVLVLDGLDEALDWQAGRDLFPNQPPAGLRVVVAARPLAEDRSPRDWLHRLGWEAPGLSSLMPVLPPLIESEVGQLVSRSLTEDEIAAVGPEPGARLHRLTEGDPLLVRHYLDEIKRRLRTGEKSLPLDQISPGYDSFFDLMLDAPGDSVLEFLALLSCALGPLFRTDLSALGVNPTALERAGYGLRRLVMGDGEVHGFVFSHPKLRDHYLERRLTATEREARRLKIANYGREVLAELQAGRLAPEAVSRFLVRYLGVHFEKSAAPLPNLLLLVNQRWADACYALDAAYTGFLDDLARLDRLLEQSSPAVAGGPEFRSALAAAVCWESGEALDSAVIAALIDEELWSPSYALQYIRERPTPKYYAMLAPRLAPEQVAETLGNLIALQSDQPGREEYVRALAAFLPRVPAGRRAEVLELMESQMRTEPYTVEQFRCAAVLLPHAGDRRPVILEWLRSQLATAGCHYAAGFKTLLAGLEPDDAAFFACAALEQSGLGKVLSQGGLDQEKLRKITGNDEDLKRAVLSTVWQEYNCVLRYLPGSYAGSLVDGILETAKLEKWETGVELAKALVGAANRTQVERISQLIERLLGEHTGVFERQNLLLAGLPYFGAERRSEAVGELLEIAAGYDGPYYAANLIDLLEGAESVLDEAQRTRLALQALRLFTGAERLSSWRPARWLRFVPAPQRRAALQVMVLGHRSGVPSWTKFPPLWALASSLPDPVGEWKQLEVDITRPGLLERREIFSRLGRLTPVPAAGRLLGIFGYEIDRIDSRSVGRIFADASPGERLTYVLRLFGMSDPDLAAKLRSASPETRAGIAGMHREVIMHLLRGGEPVIRNWPLETFDLLLAAVQIFRLRDRSGDKPKWTELMAALAGAVPENHLSAFADLVDTFKGDEAVRRAVSAALRRRPALFRAAKSEGIWLRAAGWAPPGCSEGQSLIGWGEFSEAAAKRHLKTAREVSPEAEIFAFLQVHSRLGSASTRETLERLAGSLGGRPVPHWTEVEAALEVIAAFPLETQGSQLWSFLREAMETANFGERALLVSRLAPFATAEWMNALVPLAHIGSGREEWEASAFAVLLLPHVTAPQRPALLRRLLGDYFAGRRSSLEGMGGALAELTEAQFRAFWRKFLPYAARRGWSFLMAELPHVVTALARHGKPATRAAMLQAIRETDRWWSD